jgi:alanine-glyoxylate transaminase/serine-glyoxylate transaminase/serine-pyruvate transaminase
MIADEGLEARWRRHRALADGVRAAVEAWEPAGLRLFAVRPEARADGVTTIVCDPAADPVPDVEALRALCSSRLGVTLGTGIGGFGVGFRIGHMGHVNAPMVLGVVGAVDTALAALGALECPGGAAAAARSLATAMVRGVTIA